MPHVTATFPNMRFVGSNNTFHIAAIRWLFSTVTCGETPVRPRAFLPKSIIKFTRSEKITRFKFVSALRLAVLFEIIYLCSLLYRLKTLTPCANFVKIDHAEAWKILGRKPSGLFQDLKAATLTKYFRSINLIFHQCISIALILQRNEDKIIVNTALNSAEMKTIRNWD